MKYYIPTTSLNFNCILSSESISPSGFYPIRGFGYPRWFAIPENNQDGVVLLYRSPFALARPKCDQEDHPMLIEIDTEEKFKEIGDGVFASAHTIYLNSLVDKVILFSEEDKRVVLSMADGSLETKMLQLYKGRIVVSACAGKVPEVPEVKHMSVMQEEVGRDQRINKIKGSLYGYYIGAALTSDPEDVKKLNALREVQNIFSSVASSPDRNASSMQCDRLRELMISLKYADPVYRELVGIVGSEEKADKVLDLEYRHGKELVRYNPDRMLSELKNAVGGMNSPQAWVKDAIRSHLQHMEERRKKLPVSSHEITVGEEAHLNISSKVLPDAVENRLFVSWVNDVLIKSEFSGGISSVKETLSDALTLKAKESLGDTWADGNRVKVFMNALRRHVRGEAFDVQWDSGVLSSIAAVVLKGDDWNALLSFMQGKGMTDYRLAFAFYGMLTGFANLTRDFTNIILDMEPHYVNEVYQEFRAALHGTTLIDYFRSAYKKAEGLRRRKKIM